MIHLLEACRRPHGSVPASVYLTSVNLSLIKWLVFKLYITPSDPIYKKQFTF